MLKQPAPVDLTRRQFLGTFKYVAAVGVAALAGRGALARTTGGTLPAAGAAAGGYRETGHIRQYYESARY